MKALIAFIIMAVLVLTLIEVNERIKARKASQEPQAPSVPLKGDVKEEVQNDDCEKNTDGEDCSACELLSVCDKTHTH